MLLAKVRLLELLETFSSKSFQPDLRTLGGVRWDGMAIEKKITYRKSINDLWDGYPLTDYIL